MSEDIVSKFFESQKQFENYPDIHLYDDPRREAFLTLEIAETEFDTARLTSSQISDILVNNFSISRTPQAIASTLGKAARNRLVHKNSDDKFKLMELGREELYLVEADNPGAFYIEPGKPFSAKLVLLNDILSKVENRVWISDPYVSIRLLDLLNVLEPDIQIRILTQTVQGKGEFKRALIDFKREHPKTEVRIVDSDELHDRYILSEKRMWLVGHSLKDLGRRESFIVALGEDIRNSMSEVYEERWKRSKDLA